MSAPRKVFFFNWRIEPIFDKNLFFFTKKRVVFSEKVDIKPPTVLNSIEKKRIFDGTTLERALQKLNSCQTKEEIEKESDLLLQELKLIEDRKKLGFDVSEEYENF